MWSKKGRRITFSKTSNRLVELTEPTKADFMIDVDFQVESGRVGLATRYNREAQGLCGSGGPQAKRTSICGNGPDLQKGIILRVLERHTITSPIDSNFKLSVIQSRDYQLVFINDVLAATFSFARRDAGVVGLFLENATGKCAVKGIHATPAIVT